MSVWRAGAEQSDHTLLYPLDILKNDGQYENIWLQILGAAERKIGHFHHFDVNQTLRMPL
jgi:hypothetical protein